MHVPAELSWQMNSATFVLTHAAKLLLVARSYSKVDFSSIKKIEFFFMITAIKKWSRMN